MSLVTTTVAPEIRVTPFTGISEIQRERSGIARAEVVYSAMGTWPDPGAGNTGSISFLFNLDTAYGYALMDCNAAFIKESDYVLLEATGVMEINTSTGPGGTQQESQWYQFENYPSRQNNVGTTAIGTIGASNYNTLFPITGNNGIMVYTLKEKPTSILYPFPGVDAMSSTSMFATQKEIFGGCAYRFFCRFLQYDVTQGYNYVVNSPIMTR